MKSVPASIKGAGQCFYVFNSFTTNDTVLYMYFTAEY